MAEFPVTALPRAPLAPENPLPVGTALHYDASLEFSGNDVISGGHPWRVLRMNGTAMTHLRRWGESGTVDASTGSLARTLCDQGFVHPRFTTKVELDDVDVVVPVFNDARGLERLLTSLHELHVTVVDDASVNGDEIASICRARNVTYIRLATNQGPAAARNAGARATTREFLWFLDADVTVGNAAIAFAMLSSVFGDPRVAAVAPRICGEYTSTSALAHFEERFGPLDLGRETALVVPNGRVSYVPSASLIVRRTAFGDGFDESLRSAEDVDFVWRLHDAGWLVRYEPTVVLHHRSRANTRDWLAQRASYGASAASLAARHPDRVRPVRVDAVTALTWWAVITRRWRLAGAATELAIDGVAEQLPDTLEDRQRTSQNLALRGMARSGLPLARALTRSYLPLLVLALVPRRTRRIAVLMIAAGTFERLRHQPPHPRDVLVSLADDAAYSVGLFRGAWHARRLDVIVPSVSWRSLIRETRRHLMRADAPSPSRNSRRQRASLHQ